MKRFLVFSTLVLLLPLLSVAQHVMLLERPGTTRYFIYKQGNRISVELKNINLKISGEITHIEDSSLSINNNNFLLTDIHQVTRHHKFLSGLKNKLLEAAVMYFAFSAINRTIHDERPVLDNSIPMICGSMVALSGVSYLFENSKYTMGWKWRLRVIDLSVLKVKPEDFH
jgi:hypothetical protein